MHYSECINISEGTLLAYDTNLHCTYLHDQLVGTGHQGEAVGVVESLRDVLAKSVAGASRGDAPAATVVRV